jgi:hypothetical protein
MCVGILEELLDPGERNVAVDALVLYLCSKCDERMGQKGR